MLMYNIPATAVLAFAGNRLGLHGVALWPAVALHRVNGRLVHHDSAEGAEPHGTTQCSE